MAVTRRHALGTAGRLVIAMALAPVNDQFSQFLRLAFLRSPNYAAGSAGWTINQDGSAEFNNLTVRGTFKGTNFLINATGIFFYSGAPGAGNPPVFFAVIPGTTKDSFNNNLLTNANANAVLGGGTVGAGQAIVDSLGRMTFDNGVSVFSLPRLAPDIKTSLLLTGGAVAGADAVVSAEVFAKGDTAQAVPQVVVKRAGGAVVPATTALLEVQDLTALSTVGLTGVAAPAAIAAVPQLYGSNGGSNRVREVAPSGFDAIIPGTKSDSSTITVTQAVATALTAAYTINATDGVQGAVYTLKTEGIATWGSTQQALTLSVLLGGTTIFSETVLATAFAINTGLYWEAEAKVRVQTAGAGGTVSGKLRVILSPSAGSRTVGDSVTFVRRQAGIAFNTTVASTMNLQAAWASTTGAPTITSDGSDLIRSGA